VYLTFQWVAVLQGVVLFESLRAELELGSVVGLFRVVRHLLAASCQMRGMVSDRELQGWGYEMGGWSNKVEEREIGDYISNCGPGSCWTSCFVRRFLGQSLLQCPAEPHPKQISDRENAL